jgi:hypothetical protein
MKVRKRKRRRSEVEEVSSPVLGNVCHLLQQPMDEETERDVAMSHGE